MRPLTGGTYYEEGTIKTKRGNSIMEKKKVAPHALISGILFVLMAIVLVVDLIRHRGISVWRTATTA